MNSTRVVDGLKPVSTRILHGTKYEYFLIRVLKPSGSRTFASR